MAKKEKLAVLEIDNSVNPLDSTKYVAWCDFTTMKANAEGEIQSTQIKRGDVITPAEVPPVWIEQAIAQRFLISLKDKEQKSTDELRRLGYTVKK